ncbi:MAG: DUF84 family protein, partial [Acidobacteriota bacterium]
MKLALGSTREPKLAGVRAALARLALLPWPVEGAEIAALDVASGEADTPLSDAATRAGARRRARGALAAHPDAAIALGLEGGVTVVSHKRGQVMLRNWAVAWDGQREGLGSSPGILLPGELAAALLAGEDLASAIDRLAGQRDVRSRQGAFGVLTRDLITRAGAFEQAVLAALAPLVWWSMGGTMNPRNPWGGWVEVVTGCMFSGKSEELIR